MRIIKPVLFTLALKHLLARRRQSVVSLMGIVLGVAFFLAVSSLMKGSEADSMRRLVDNSPHITVSDDFRTPRRQPLSLLTEKTPFHAVEIRRVKPISENRGIRDFGRVLSFIKTLGDLKVSALLQGQALVRFAGKTSSLTLSGMVPEEMRSVTTLADYMVEGQIETLMRTPDGIIIGANLARELSLHLHDTLMISSAENQTRPFKIIGIFRTGRSGYDRSQAFVTLKRAQILFNQPNRANSVILKLKNPAEAPLIAQKIERQFGYQSVSWQESSEDLLNTLAIRNRIMYTVVSAVLVVAAFGIYNVISTVVLEKQKDIAILKAMGFYASDIEKIFLIQGGILGLVGCGSGLPLGCLFMLGLEQIRFKPPGGNQWINMPIDWGISQFLIAALFALSAALFAAWLPARRAAELQPVDVLRGL